MSITPEMLRTVELTEIEAQKAKHIISIAEAMLEDGYDIDAAHEISEGVPSIPGEDAEDIAEMSVEIFYLLCCLVKGIDPE